MRQSTLYLAREADASCREENYCSRRCVRRHPSPSEVAVLGGSHRGWKPGQYAALLENWRIRRARRRNMATALPVVRNNPITRTARWQAPGNIHDAAREVQQVLMFASLLLHIIDTRAGGTSSP